MTSARAPSRRASSRSPGSARSSDHRALVAVEAQVVRALALAPGRPPGARVVAAVRALDLHDVGAEVAEQHRGERPGEHAREVGDEDAVQRRHRAGRLRHRDADARHLRPPSRPDRADRPAAPAGPARAAARGARRRRPARDPRRPARAARGRAPRRGGRSPRRSSPTSAASLGPGGELLLLAGNHDHGIAAGWIDARLQTRAAQASSGLEQRFAPAAAGPLARRLAEAALPRRAAARLPRRLAARRRLRDARPLRRPARHRADVRAPRGGRDGALRRQAPRPARRPPTTTRPCCRRCTRGCTRSRSAPTTRRSAPAPAPRRARSRR